MDEKELYRVLEWPEDRFYHVLHHLKERDSVRSFTIDDGRTIYLKGISPSLMDAEEIQI